LTVVHRHELFAQVVGRALGLAGYRCRRVTVAGLTPRAVVHRVVGTRPDLVLVGLDTEAGGTGTVIEELAQMGLPVVAMSDDASPAGLGRAFAAGARAIASKDMTLDHFLALVREQVEGSPRMTAHQREDLIEAYLESSSGIRGRLATLTKQERDLLAYLMEGMTVSEVARSRHVSEGTVRSQLRAVMGKLEVHSQLAAVAVAWQAGHDPQSLHADADG
jgi:two-component system, NarL family, nitrate/nitrite response regulator NarL